jgi:hypothetical protein
VGVGDEVVVRGAFGLSAKGREDLGAQRSTVAYLGFVQTQQVQHRGPDVDTSGSIADDDGLLEAEGKAQDERDLGRLAEYVTRMPFEPALSECLSVVRCHDDERLLRLAATSQLLEEGFEHLVRPEDGVVVDVGVGRSEERSVLAVQVLMDVHQVHVEEPAFVSVDTQELTGGRGGIEIASAGGERRVLRPDPWTHGLGDGTHIRLEALTESEIAHQPTVAEDPRGSKAGRGQDLRGQLGLLREHLVESGHATPIGV